MSSPTAQQEISTVPHVEKSHFIDLTQEGLLIRALLSLHTPTVESHYAKRSQRRIGKLDQALTTLDQTYRLTGQPHLDYRAAAQAGESYWQLSAYQDILLLLAREPRNGSFAQTMYDQNWDELATMMPMPDSLKFLSQKGTVTLDTFSLENKVFAPGEVVYLLIKRVLNQLPKQTTDAVLLKRRASLEGVLQWLAKNPISTEADFHGLTQVQLFDDIYLTIRRATKGSYTFNLQIKDDEIGSLESVGREKNRRAQWERFVEDWKANDQQDLEAVIGRSGDSLSAMIEKGVSYKQFYLSATATEVTDFLHELEKQGFRYAQGTKPQDILILKPLVSADGRVQVSVVPTTPGVAGDNARYTLRFFPGAELVAEIKAARQTEIEAAVNLSWDSHLFSYMTSEIDASAITNQAYNKIRGTAASKDYADRESLEAFILEKFMNKLAEVDPNFLHRVDFEIDQMKRRGLYEEKVWFSQPIKLDTKNTSFSYTHAELVLVAKLEVGQTKPRLIVKRMSRWV